MKIETGNIGLGNNGEKENGGNGFNDEEMVRKKEKEINRAELRKLIQEGIKNALLSGSNITTLDGNKELTEVQRLHANEARVQIIEDVVADLSEDSLQLSRRVVSIGKSIRELNTIVRDIQNDIKNMKETSALVATTEEKYETKRDKTYESKRDTYLRIAVIVISIVAIIVSIWGYARGG